MTLWGVELPVDAASAEERAYLEEVARRYPATVAVAGMWALLDEVWTACGASVDRLDSAAVRAFYRHPVWLVNSAFVEADPESREHREALAAWVAATGRSEIVEFGGGYGALARRMAACAPQTRIRIVDPFPSPVSAAACAPFRAIRYVPEVVEPADVVIAQDVLEHVADPVGMTAQLVRKTQVGGLLVFANCFEPCIRCHVPATFHLARTFPQLMRLLGCAPRGVVAGCEHALVFERVSGHIAPNWTLALFERYSRTRYRLVGRAAR